MTTELKPVLQALDAAEKQLSTADWLTYLRALADAVEARLIEARMDVHTGKAHTR